MSGFDVSTAFVVVLPDTKLFREKLQAEVIAAVAAVQVPNVGAGAVENTKATAEASIANTRLASTAAAATAGVEGLSVAQTEASAAAVRESAAALAVTRSLEAQRLAENKLTAAIAANADAARIRDLQNKSAIATEAVSVARQRQSAVIAANTQAAALAAERAAIADAALADSSAAAALATEQLAVAQTVVEGTSVKEAAAALAVTRALETERLAMDALTAAIARNADASTIQALAQKATIASGATSVAQLRLADATTKVEKGLISTSQRADIAQGSLIGLTRITGISALGLTAYSAAAVAAGLALKSAITSAASFEQQLNTFQAVTGATADEMEAVSQAAKDLGADLTLPAVSANDALVALTELAKAGLSLQDALAGTEGVLRLSSAAAIGVGEAAQIAATQLNAFQLAGDQTTRVAELLADASISAQGEITDFAAGFQQAGAVANQVGLSIEDTTALLTELGKAGLRGADGGTSLRTALLRLVPTTKEAAEFQDALGISLDKTKSIGDQIVPLIEQYRTALADLTPIQQQQTLTQIFGQDAIRAASIIFGQEEGALRSLTDEFERSNSIQALTDAKTKGLAGSYANLKSQAETLSTKLGTLVNAGLKPVVDELVLMFDATNNAIDALGNLADIPVIDIPITFSFGLAAGAKSFFDSLPAAVKAATITALGPGLETQILSQVVLNRLRSTTDKAEKEILGPPAPIQTPQQLRQGGRGLGAGTPLSAAEIRARLDPEARARQDAIDAAIKSQADAKAKEQIPIPLPLQQDLVDAQLKGSLQAELKADNAIVDFIRARRDKLQEGTKRFLAVSQQLEDAQAQRDAVQSQIDGDVKQAAATAKQKRDAATAEALRLAREAEEDERKKQAAQALLAQTILDIQNQRFQNRLTAADFTESNDDNIRILNAQIKVLDGRRKAAQKIADVAKKGSQAQKDAQLQVAKLNGEILGLRSQIKNLGKGGPDSSFSLQDLFQEAVSEFNAFGSNISTTGLLSGQDARGAFSDIVINDAVAQSQLTEAQKQTELLRKIAAHFDIATGTAPAVPGNRQGAVGSLVVSNIAHSAAVDGLT